MKNFKLELRGLKKIFKRLEQMMTNLINEKIKILGGMEKLRGEGKILSNDVIKEFESATSLTLPEDYKYFLKIYGDAYFNEYVVYSPKSETAIYVHDEVDELPNYWFKGSSVGSFHGLHVDDEDEELELMTWFKCYKERMPERFLAIADDGMGNQVCMSLAEVDYGKVYWWDHENEWDAEGYEEDTGKAMPDEAKYQNVYLLAESFTEFIQGLTIYEDDED